MSMKVKSSFFEAGAKHYDEKIVRYIQDKYKTHSNANFFNLDTSEASLRQFVEMLRERDIYDEDLIDRLTDKIVAESLHPLQCLRLAQIINDPDEDLEGEDKEALIDQVLNLQWPKELKH